MKFVQFTEYNDWEGETWNFWLQLDGNETQLKKLKKFLADNNIEDNPGYELDMTPVDESEVDILVKHSNGGYMNDHNKVTGKLKLELPEDDGTEDWAWEYANDTFYKGQIEDLFHD